MAEAVDILKDRIRELEDKNRSLEDDNKKQRDEIRTYKADIETKDTQITELNKKLPSDDAVILNKADAARWDIAKNLADKAGGFDKLETLSTERDEALKTLAEKDRNETISKAGFDAAKFNRLFANHAVSITGEGNDVTLELVIKDGEAEKKVSVFELAESEGITDLVNAARITTSESQQETPRKIVVIQANERTPKATVITTEQVKEEMKSTGNYDF